MVCFPFKCYPCLKAFEGGKLVMALVLLIIGAMMIVQEPNIVDCNKFTAQCPTAFNTLLDATSTATTPAEKAAFAEVKKNKTNEIQSMCSCMSSCMNYFLVYDDNKTSTDKNNCFAKSSLAGVMGSVNSAPAYTAKEKGSNSLVGATGRGTCSSCEDVSGNEHKIFRALGGLALTCALALAVSATCEYKGVKMGNKCFSLCTLFTDVSVILLLGAATGIASVGYIASKMACDPDKISIELSKAGDASADSKDNGAAFFKFFIDLLAPLASGLCGQSKKFAVFALSSFVALVFTKLTVLATCCICCKCTKDGSDKHDHNAKEMQKLMNDSESDVE
jgi:hypothetical protein